MVIYIPQSYKVSFWNGDMDIVKKLVDTAGERTEKVPLTAYRTAGEIDGQGEAATQHREAAWHSAAA